MSRRRVAYLPPTLEQRRTWGWAVNLYALRSKRNWGIGDFSDLREFVGLAARLGADLVGVNPLHALHDVDPGAASPYSPTSRYFLNPLYVDVEAVPEFVRNDPLSAAARARVAEPAFAAALEALRAAPLVDYTGVASRKRPLLEALYDVFVARGEPVRSRAFARFVTRGGERLERFACYEALDERFATDGGRTRGWLTWPADYRDPSSSAVADFARQQRRRIDFFKYLQFVADAQLAAVARAAAPLGIGLYRDLAVGADLESADVWSDRDAYVLDETVGAPPDPLGPLGQNWGLPPPDPAALLAEGGARFIALLRANMAHAGALRFDHAMWMQRLFRIPRGRPALEGAYVPYPLEALLALLRRESARHRCLVVGEDLGSVPEGFSERIQREHVLSYRLLLFERELDGRFRPPAAYPALALATATTHDLPTLAGWAIGRDLDVRLAAGLLTKEPAAAARTQRRVEATCLLEALRAAGELDVTSIETLHRTIDARIPNGRAYAPLIAAAYRYLARTPARVILVQLDDALGELDQVNLPGTFTEYPNWRRKVGIDLDDIAADERVATIAAEVAARVGRESVA